MSDKEDNEHNAVYRAPVEATSDKAAEVKSLYAKDGSYTHVGLALDRELWADMEKVMRKYVDVGYSIREVAHVVQGTVFDIECCIALDMKGKV